MGIEPTTRDKQVTGFEDQGSHQAPFTSSRPGSADWHFTSEVVRRSLAEQLASPPTAFTRGR